MKKIYFVATFRDYDNSPIYCGLKGGRTVGYFETLEEAKRCVEENWGDIYEDGYYKYAVIEGAEPGLYPTCLDTKFYKWKDGSYKRIRRPKKLKNICNFTIG